MLLDWVKKNRSYRRFFENETIDREVLLELINLARLSPSGANRQALRYYVSCEPGQNESIFSTLGWAAYLQEWPGPIVGERPSAYIIMGQEQEYKMALPIDTGIAAQTILLGAAELGLGGCMIANINRTVLRSVLNIPESFEILLVIALGKPKEEIVIDEIDSGADIKYWRDAQQVHHVPKRKLKDIIIN